MIRGKCILNQIDDLIKVVNQIKKLVREDKKKMFRIIEIQNRFTN